MAQLVGIFASSHTPQLKLGLDLWDSHGARDQVNPLLLGKDAEYHSYNELLEAADPAIQDDLRPDVWASRYEQSQRDLAELNRLLAEAQPDVAVVIGDDQAELFQDEGVPTFALFLGSEMTSEPHDHETDLVITGAEREIHRIEEGLNAHLVDTLVESDFDITVFSRQPGGRGLGHAFTFPRDHMKLPADVRLVPVFVNTYYPPNTPSARRAYDLGTKICEAIASWDSDARVVVIASGGLSHFVVDEELDRGFLDALASDDTERLFTLTRKQLRSGTSELLNWIAAAGAGQKLKPTVLDYIPGYRTPAGTGCGLGFAHWL